MPSLLQRITNSIFLAMMWVLRNWLGCFIGLIALLALHRNRFQLMNLLNTFRWKLGLWWRPQRALILTLNLLHQRAELTGAAPKKSKTHHQWLGEMMTRTNDINVAQSLYALRKLIDAAAYAPHSKASEKDCAQICQTCQRGCSLKWFQTEYQQSQAADDQNQVSQAERMKHVEYTGAAHHEY
ncbi:hypothetical protein [Thalassoglobus polymorphus]|uniref:hypothetical protein n=1 Tax=Thalassoglobus polymorphus TaxID=2527994 RepID=UPI001E2D2BD4|nr:hypothetical protein [Thalassoglobus polymorphus]